VPKTPLWTIDTIKSGVERYYLENGKYPSATDFDETYYLPSSRQIQRAHGGLEKLRTVLKLEEINYTKGPARSAIALEGYKRGLSAEDMLEAKLIDYFGEPFVHTQKRYYKLLKNRYDFFIYHHNGYFGVDIFSPTRNVYIAKNVYHKIKKYADISLNIPIFFVIDSVTVTTEEVEKIQATIKPLKELPNIKLMLLSDFLEYIQDAYHPLSLPYGLKQVLKTIEQK
jgi:hypothetical protein